MNKAKAAVVRFIKNEEGLTTVEYAVAGALIAGATVAAFTQLGAQVKAVVDGIKQEIGG